MTYINQLNAAYDKWLETLNYDYNNANHKEQFAVGKPIISIITSTEINGVIC